MSEHVFNLLQISFKILPFVVIILFELSPISFRGTFESVFSDSFESTRYRLIDESGIEILREEFEGEGSITQSDIQLAFGRLQTQAGLDDETTRKVVADFATFSNDRLSTRLSLSVTGISILGIILAEVATMVSTWCRFIQSAVLLTLFAGFVIVVTNLWISQRFEVAGAHGYSRNIEHGRPLLPKQRILFNLLVICAILLFEIIF
ncbi:hypothetical protein [Haloarcula sp. Atlit-120R]|uniref:hypothetical protein n=1 Tax=Haloarcula sp. Atlit-120R TaxID=2282135 RepID=UPI000EF26A20|nr:hypothetical protein [Haloarcula sp. Atlit-120R]RLM32581.1 hypothetical protein DVK01_20690 [Haloarcula sp. Atlit-120R]